MGPAANPREHGVFLKPFGIIRQSAYATQCRMRHCVATMPESDFSGSCISGYGSSPSRCGPSGPNRAYGQSRDLPVPVQGASVHARVSDHAGSGRCSQ